MSDWTQGRMTAFWCLRCSAILGRFPETTHGVPARCATCAALPPTIHPGWRTTPSDAEVEAAGTAIFALLPPRPLREGVAKAMLLAAARAARQTGGANG